MPEFVLGFKALAESIGLDKVGAPTTDEIYITPDHCVQGTTKGTLIYYKKIGKSFFHEMPAPPPPPIKLRLAILPSVQERNVVCTIWKNEMEQMRWFVPYLENACREHPQIEFKSFLGRSEIYDKSHKESLYAQQREAYAWLKASPIKGQALNFHTDAGSRHVGYCYSTSPGSKVLGAAICEKIKGYFGNRVMVFDYRTYIMSVEMHGLFNALLLELGSHQSVEDTKNLHDNAQVIANWIVNQICAYHGVP